MIAREWIDRLSELSLVIKWNGSFKITNNIRTLINQKKLEGLFNLYSFDILVILRPQKVLSMGIVQDKIKLTPVILLKQFDID